MASTSDSKTVSFSDIVEQFVSESDPEEDENYLDDYVESVSEGEHWSSNDEDQLELFDQLLEGARFGSLIRLDPVQRNSLLLFDKDFLNEDDEELDGSSVYSEISSSCSGMFCSTSQSSQSEEEHSDIVEVEPPSKQSKTEGVSKDVQAEPLDKASSSRSQEPTTACTCKRKFGKGKKRESRKKVNLTKIVLKRTKKTG